MSELISGTEHICNELRLHDSDMSNNAADVIEELVDSQVNHVYVVVDWRHGGKILAMDFAFTDQDAAERYAHELRTFLRTSLEAVGVVCLSVGDYYCSPS